MAKRVLPILKRVLPLLFGVAVLVYLFTGPVRFEDRIDEVKLVERTETRVTIELEGDRTEIPVHEYIAIDATRGRWVRRGVWSNFRAIPPLLLSIAALLGIFSFIAAAFRLKILVAALGHRVGLWRMLVYTLVGQLYNSAIPGGAVGGDAVKALYVAQSTGSRPQAFAAVLVDRLCGLFALAGIAMAMLIPSLHEPGMRNAAYVIVAFAAAATTAIVVMTSRRLRKLVPEGLAAKLPFRETITAFDQAMQVFRGHKRGLVAAVAISIVPQACWIGMHIAIGHGIGIEGIGWTDYAVLIPVSGMVAALPVSFGGWGVGELAAVYFFGLRGVGAGAAFTLSLLGRTIQLAWALIGFPLSLALPKASGSKGASP